MITGFVNADREAIIRLRVVGSGGQEQEIDAVIDTGFTGYLTLPPMTIAALNLPFQSRQQVILRAGKIVYDPTGLSMPDWQDAPPEYWTIP